MMGPPVPSLKALSLAAVCTHIWHCRDLSAALVDVSLADANKVEASQKIPKEMFITYYNQVTPAYNAIMDLDCLSESVKVLIACAFIKLETNMFQWAKDIAQLLERPKRKENVAYCLMKTVWRSDLTIDREKTMFTVLFDSHGRVRLSYYGPGNICVLTVYNLYRFIECGRYRKHDSLSKKIRLKLKHYKPLRHWKNSIRFISFILKLKHSKMELLMRAVNYTKVEVLDNLLCKLSMIFPLRSKVYTLLLTHALLSDGEHTAEHEVIIYLLDRLHIFDQKSWVQIMIHYFCDIILWIFLSTDAEYCITYYQKVCELVSVEECVATVKRLLEEMTSFTNDYGRKAEFLKNRAVFLEIWNRTPVKVKQALFKYLVHEKLFVYGNIDIITLCVLLSDKAFDEDQRNTMLLANFLDMQESHKEQVEEFLSHLPACCKDFVKNPTKKALKTYIAGRMGSESYANVNCVFEDEETLNGFKKEILLDKNFLIDTLSALWENFSEPSATNFLLWLLDTEESVKSFVKEKIVGQQWIVAIVEKYLLSENFTMKDSSLLDFFVEDAEDRLKIKKVIRQDFPLMCNVLDQMCTIWVSEINTYLPCVFSPHEADEKRDLMERYLLSKKGKQAICAFVTRDEDLKNVDLYTKHKLKLTLHAMKTFKECWVEPFNLTQQVLDVLSSAKIQSESPVLFPHQTEKDGEVIVSRNLRMFRLILDQDTEVDDLIFNVMVEISLRTSYDYLEDDMF